MRLEAQMKGGFYPAPAEAITLAGTFLRPPVGEPFSIVDPCAGEGHAIKQLGESLDCPRNKTYAIELDDSRAETIREVLAEANVLAPASFFGCRATIHAFSLVWLNPPFDQAYSGHRVESQFLLSATDWLMPRGIMIFVCPENVVEEWSNARRHFAGSYENCTIVPFPAKHRRFNEVMVLGQKRLHPQPDSTWDSSQARAGFIYQIPPGPGPRFFQKVEPTESELHVMLSRSPLSCHLKTLPSPALPCPPLALGMGHVALLLASGHLDSVVHIQGKAPHVVRGTSRKKEVIAEVTETEDAEGRMVKKTIISEQIELVVRTVDLAGRIQTFMNNAEEP